jgi:hypothetical protein
MSLQNLKRIGESVSADCKAGAMYPEHFQKVIKEEGHLP